MPSTCNLCIYASLFFLCCFLFFSCFFFSVLCCNLLIYFLNVWVNVSISISPRLTYTLTSHSYFLLYNCDIKLKRGVQLMVIMGMLGGLYINFEMTIIDYEIACNIMYLYFPEINWLIDWLIDLPYWYDIYGLLTYRVYLCQRLWSRWWRRGLFHKRPPTSTVYINTCHYDYHVLVWHQAKTR